MMVKIKFSNENIVHALIGALEGGSNYWYFLPDVSMVKKIDNKSLSECIVLSALSGIEIPVYDVEAEDIFLGNISKSIYATAIILNALLAKSSFLFFKLFLFEKLKSDIFPLL